MDAAKDDVIGFRTTRGVAGQLERVAGDISELDDLIALVMVPKDENPCSEGGLRGSGAFDQIGVRGRWKLTRAVHTAFGFRVAASSQQQKGTAGAAIRAGSGPLVQRG